MAIKDYYQQLDKSQKTDFICQVCKLCDISIPSFYRKISSGGFKKTEETLIKEKIINRHA